MNFADNFKIATKVLAMILFMGAVAMAVALTSSSILMRADARYSTVITAMPITTKLARANRQAVQMVYDGYRAMAYDGGDPRSMPFAEDENQSYSRALDLLETSAKIDASVSDEVASYRARFEKLHGLTRQAIILGRQNRDAEAKPLLVEADEALQTLAADMANKNDAHIAKYQKMSNDLSDTAASNAFWLKAFSIVGLIFGSVLSYFASKIGIAAPIARLQEAMGKLANGNNRIEVPGTERGDELGGMAKAVMVFRDTAQAKEAADIAKAQADAEQKMVVETLSESLETLSSGDLTKPITREFPGEYVALKSNFNAALDALRDLIGAVADSAETIRTGSTEIAQASEDLARRTESNAASLEETSAAVTQMDGRLKATAEAASRTVGRADEAITTVSGGRSIADEAVQAMGRVSDSAKGIDGVIEGLDKIAFQTRVLAMNAAVEAGRAGDAGRGFAVVADLVSALAMRAEEEAKAARDQLTVTQADIVTAVNAVRRVDGALADISEGVGEVHSLLGQMAADNQAQSSAITQITVAIGTMDQSTQQNAAMVEQTSAAARNLTSEVASLAEQAARFKTGNQAARPVPPRPEPIRAKALPVRAGYTSPVKALPVAALAAANGADHGDWTAF